MKNLKNIIGDDVFVKKITDPIEGDYFRAIIHDSKLSPGTPWSSNQKTELIEWFKNNPTRDFITFEVRSQPDKLPVNSTITTGTDVRIYRTDVWKSRSNGSGGIGSTVNLNL